MPILTTISLVASNVLLSSKKWFWNDELVAQYIIGDPVFSHLGRALNGALEVNPPLYFLVGWLWARIFGASEIPLRLLSSAGMCVASGATWSMLRRTYSFWPATLGTLTTFCLSDLILYQNAEARAYGCFLGLFAVALWLLERSNRDSNLTPAAIAMNACIQAALCMTHVFGVVYSGVLLLAQWLHDRNLGAWRPGLYASFVAGWLSWLAYLPWFLRQATNGFPRGWVLVPSARDLINTLTLSPSPFVQCFLLLLFLSIAVLHAGEGTAEQGREQRPTARIGGPEGSILWLARILVAVPFFVWGLSRVVKPIFVGRYMIPTTLVWAIVVAHTSARLLGDHPASKQREVAATWRGSRAARDAPLWVLVSLLLTYPLYVAASAPTEARPGSQDGRYGHEGLPIVVPFSHDFVQRVYYSPQRRRYRFILDWPTAVDPGSGTFPPGEFKVMDALAHNYPEVFADQVVAGDDFLQRNERFLVFVARDYDRSCSMLDLHCPRWLQVKILQDPNYRISQLGEIDGKTMLLVERSR